MRWIAHALPPLVAAHAQGIIHRDLKPANLFIALNADGTEELKLLDFGLARDTRQKSRTETGIALGTPYYMSPEQAMRPKEVGPATDVWALGVMMYEVLAGHMPFDGETLHAVVLQSSTRPHVPLASRQPELDPALCELVEDCLCKDPDMRPHDASALLARLFPLLDDPSICYQLTQPIAAARVASERTARNNQVDPISYADTAITMPAPRINETEASYAPRRSTNTTVLVPVVLSIAMLGGAVIGYLRFAPASHLRDEQPAKVQEQTPPLAAVTAPALQAPAPIAPVQEPVQAPPPAAAVPEQPAQVTESITSAARDARAQPVSKTASKRGSPRGRRGSSVEQPLPSVAAPLQSPVRIEPSPATPGPSTAPEAPASAAEWEKIDDQLQQAMPAQEPKAEALPRAPEAVAPVAPAPEVAEPAAPPSPEPTPEATPQFDLLPPPEPPVDL
jgi:serine/threonine-protein kinase